MLTLQETWCFVGSSLGFEVLKWCASRLFICWFWFGIFLGRSFAVSIALLLFFSWRFPPTRKRRLALPWYHVASPPLGLTERVCYVTNRFTFRPSKKFVTSQATPTGFILKTTNLVRQCFFLRDLWTVPNKVDLLLLLRSQWGCSGCSSSIRK